MTDTVVLAVDFGGTKIEAALARSDGSIVEGTRFRSPTGREATASQLETAAAGLVCVDRVYAGRIITLSDGTAHLLAFESTDDSSAFTRRITHPIPLEWTTGGALRAVRPEHTATAPSQ